MDNILFIAPPFHNYENRIYRCLKSSHKYKNVILKSEFPIKWHSLYLVIDNLLPKISNYLKKRFNKNIINWIIKYNVGCLFIIRGKYVDKETIKEIKIRFPKLRIVLYEWDSIVSNPNITNLIEEISESYSFDFEDSNSYQCLKYLPLFYSFDQLKKYSEPTTKSIDFFYLGGFYEERIPVIKRIKELCAKNNWRFFYKIVIPFNVYVKHYKQMKKYRNYISFKSVGFNEYYELLKKSKCVIDVVSPDQTGLTIRTIESLSQYCHLLTTNKKIINSPFYTENNITLINPDNISEEQLNYALSCVFDKTKKESIFSTADWLRKMDLI